MSTIEYLTADKMEQAYLNAYQTMKTFEDAGLCKAELIMVVRESLVMCAKKKYTRQYQYVYLFKRLLELMYA